MLHINSGNKDIQHRVVLTVIHEALLAASLAALDKH